MKILAPFVLAAALMAPTFVQSAPPRLSSLPPPGMNDPGVDAKAPPARLAPRPAAGEAASSASPSNDNPMTRKVPELPTMHDDRAGPPPSVSVRQEGENSIQEYRESGRVYMVVVTPKHGVPQTYMVDSKGMMHDDNGAPPVQPAMYKVLEWGKSKPAETRDDAQDNGQP